MSKLEKNENEILESFEKGEWHSIKNLKSEIKNHQIIAKSHLKKDKRINIRISSKDFEDIRKKAVIEGIPYQTLISSIIHKYNSGRLKDNPN